MSALKLGIPALEHDRIQTIACLIFFFLSPLDICSPLYCIIPVRFLSEKLASFVIVTSASLMVPFNTSHLRVFAFFFFNLLDTLTFILYAAIIISEETCLTGPAEEPR